MAGGLLYHKTCYTKHSLTDKTCLFINIVCGFRHLEMSTKNEEEEEEEEKHNESLFFVMSHKFLCRKQYST